VTVCPLDGQAVADLDANHEQVAPRPDAAQNAFNVKLITPFLSAGTYRVFIERSNLIFIQLQGGSSSILDAVAPFLGPFGGLITVTSLVLNRGKSKLKRQRLVEGNPEDLLHEGESNFKLHQTEIREATIKAPARLATSGKSGRLNFVVRHGEKIRCEFADASEMRRAIQLLVPMLNSTLKINAKWNGPGKSRLHLAAVGANITHARENLLRRAQRN
jgi:hypothetical protein